MSQREGGRECQREGRRDGGSVTEREGGRRKRERRMGKERSRKKNER